MAKRKHDPWQIELSVDAMYFHAARTARKRAEDAKPRITKAENHWTKLERREDDIKSRYGDPMDMQSPGHNELERVAIEMESAHYGLGEAYAYLFKEAANVHMLCAASLEAWINWHADERLTAAWHSQFDRLSLEGKWLYLPRLVKKKGLQPDREPYQSFVKLIRYRNALIHYKGRREEWAMGVIPQFVQNLGLTYEAMDLSIDTAIKMIKEMSDCLKIEQPFWLRQDIDSLDYLEVTAERQ